MSTTHPLVDRVRRALRQPGAAEREYLALLRRRLAALVAVGDGRSAAAADLGLGARERALARRFLRPREASWDDGDENLVRGWLDRWRRGSGGRVSDPQLDERAPDSLRRERKTGNDERAVARALLAAADALAAMEARPQALWFFLWEMESVLAGLDARIPALPSQRPRRS